MRCLDLFCGAGGAGMGYHQAGFEVVGWDIEHHHDYPFEHHVGDALEVLADVDYVRSFDLVHASPPCQAYTTMSNRSRGDWPDLLEPVRERLERAGVPFIIENVPGARKLMRSPVTLHGGMFGLRVNRPRLFESNVALIAPVGPKVVNPVGVYGKFDGRRLFTRADGTTQRAARSLEEAGRAMGIDWMADPRDVAEAIPPAFTEHLGRQVAEHLGPRPVRGSSMSEED